MFSNRIFIAFLLIFGGIAAAHDFVGVESCRHCHPDAYAAWLASPHARSRDALSPQQKRQALCLACHSPNEADQHVIQVTCETCHGGGQYYARRYVMRDPELARLVGLVEPQEATCRVCHDDSSPSLKPFDFKKALEAIDHWTKERAQKGTPRFKSFARLMRW